MGQLPWLKQYSGQTTDELIALEGKYRTDSIVVAFREAIDQKLEKLGRASLSAEELVILAVEAFEGEVNNDGYDGFFTNYAKEFADVIVDSLVRIGRKEVAELTERAIRNLKIDGPLTVEAIDKVMSEDDGERDHMLQECDDAYFQMALDLADSLLPFIKNNREKINLR